MTKGTKSSGVNVLVAVLVLGVLGFSGYTVFNEVSVSNEITMTSETTNITETSAITETAITEAAINSFDMSAEMTFLDGKLNYSPTDESSMLSGPLGWIGIVSGFSNAHLSEDGTKTVMTLETNSNLLEAEQAKQLFIMDYILNHKENEDKFTVFNAYSDEHEITDESPYNEGTLAYLKYDDFNAVYKSFFGTDFDTDKALKSDTAYDKNGDYVYYDNRRAGSNGINVSSMETTHVIYEESTGIYTASLAVNYSDRASQELGYSEGNAELIYTKDQNGNIILKSYMLM